MSTHEEPQTLYRYRFGAFELDEARVVFRQNGVVIPMPAKPWSLLLLLLKNAPKVVTHQEIYQEVWAGRAASGGTVNQVLIRLRQFLQDEDQTLIKNARGVGFCFTGDLQRIAQAGEADNLTNATAITISAATKPRDRPAWTLLRPLTTGGNAPLWLGEHQGTHEQRVFKFAFDALGKSSLKKEVMASRVLADEAIDGFLPVLHWDFSEAPYFIELPYLNGVRLSEWLANEQADVSAVALLADVAGALQSAHLNGVIHGDLSLSNIMVQRSDAGLETPVLLDFGSAHVAASERLRALELSMPLTDAAAIPRVGQLMYAAPELLRGEAASAAADIYALGVMLFQCVAHDARRTLSPGWESAVRDPLLREDILLMCQPNPEDRPSAQQVCQRLRELERRRASQATENALAQQTQVNHANRRKRRRYLATIAVLSTLFVMASIGWIHARQKAEQVRAHLRRADQQLMQSTDSKTKNVVLFLGHHVFAKIYGGTEVGAAFKESMADVDRDLKNQTDLQFEVYAQFAHSFSAAGDVLSTQTALSRLMQLPKALSPKTRRRAEFDLAMALHLSGDVDRAKSLFARLAAEFRADGDETFAQACEEIVKAH
jgi:eukaryotic-like serine/threonine-protein kinase